MPGVDEAAIGGGALLKSGVFSGIAKGLAGGLTSSFGIGGKGGNSRTTNTIWGPQANLFKDIYSGAQDLLPNDQYINQGLQAGQAAAPGLIDAAGNAMPAWSNLVQGGANAGFDPNVDPINALAGGQGQAFDTYSNLMNPQGNPYLDQMAGRGLDQMYQNYSRNTAPGIAQNAAFSGGMGGSRQGVAEANALNDMNIQGGNYLTNLYGGQYAGDQNRALAAAGGYNQAQTGAIQTAADIGGNADVTSLNAIGQGQNALNLGFAGPNLYQNLSNMQWSPFQNAQGVAGPAYTSESRTKSSKSGFGSSLGFGG